MASEDSDQILPGLLEVHRLRDLCDLHQTAGGPMAAAGHDVHAAHELLKVVLLGRPERMSLKERDDPFEQVSAPADDVLMQMLLVVVVATIDGDAPTPKNSMSSSSAAALLAPCVTTNLWNT